MTRAVKFRAYDPEKKIMIDDQDQDAQKHYKFTLGGWIHDTVWRIGKLNGTLMQYTGLRDRNGVEIYEGDIIDSQSLWQGEVWWNEQNLQWWANDHPLWVISKPEIIGNIYQHPELLERQE
ncbi:MAG TPA: YopX family protein [Candidatus Babeliales bacterium]|jgi:hypothetical protein|nr:YopX family protein [Candidatus Babeliales bacterium]